MRTVGVVVEYNPFHNGHLFHLTEARKKNNADVVVAVMSGYFLQRGEPALVSKWTRTSMALAGGADVVIELPYAYSTQKAEVFAFGAISLLDSLGVEEVCFGSEEGRIEPFYQLVSFIKSNKQQWDSKIQQYVANGVSYPKATALAFLDLRPNKNEILNLSLPNNILGYHYVDAINKLNSPMNASTVSRKSANYHDINFATESIASATSIRKSLDEEQDINKIKSVVPPTTLEYLLTYQNTYGMFGYWEQYFPFLKYRILTAGPKELHLIYEAEEGLENRIKKKITEAETFEQFMELIKTKRYTWNRLQRYCLHILTNTYKYEMTPAKCLHRPTYLRLLGMSQKGQLFLNQQKKHLDIPIVSRLSSHSNPMLELDIKAAACYSIIFPKHVQQKLLKEEFSMAPIRS